MRFGQSSRLVGVLTPPTGRYSGDLRQPDLLLLRSGILHRAGASRLHVGVARAAASMGFASLRFDFSGVGDTDARPDDDLSFEQNAVLETGEAMDHLASLRASNRFILIGHRSGADIAFRAAVGDPRVVGLIQLDGRTYPTARYHLLGFARRALDPRSWTRSLRRGARALRAPAADGTEGRASTAGHPHAETRRCAPPREEVARGLRRLVGRDVRLFCFFAGAHAGQMRYGEQYEHAFHDVDFAECLRVDFLEDADRGLTSLRHQEQLVNSVLEWLVENFPPDHAAPAPEIPLPAMDPSFIE
jgi:pimeloyl-ACP methyl ester carboxylesterase